MLLLQAAVVEVLVVVLKVVLTETGEAVVRVL
jgi:hypothetical protein